MAEIEIYTANYCPYCTRAKELLKRKGAKFKEIDVTDDTRLRVEAMKRSGGRKTVPQIFINNQSIGGCDDLHDMDAKGELDKLLAN